MNAIDIETTPSDLHYTSGGIVEIGDYVVAGNDAETADYGRVDEINAAQNRVRVTWLGTLSGSTWSRVDVLDAYTDEATARAAYLERIA